MTSTYSLANLPRRVKEDGERDANRYENLVLALSRRAQRIVREHGERLQQFWADAADAYGRVAAAAKEGRLVDDAKAYATDAAQRGALMLDILRERADRDAAHEAAGTPPVLIYDYDVILDGKTLSRPCNKALLRILPPEGVEVDERKRPFMIVEPRSGLGAGIGGFRPDSQVGVALHNGHPVYFVVFRQHPDPGQTLADAMHAEAEFVAEISRLHPEAPKSMVVGNCQGGWATMIMAACNPEITGPIVINGAPISTWSGKLGENAMRYNGGMMGGGLPALLLSDLGDGEYDGAYMVSGFEMANPGRNYFGKYYDVFAAPEKQRKSFLEFEKWWGAGRGGFEEAVIRMLILLAEAQAAIGRDRLEVSAEVLSHDEPFASLPPERRTALIQEQSIIVEFEPELAVKTLPDLLPKPEDRKRAVELVRFIAGRIAEMEPKTIQALETFHRILRLPPLALTAPTKDPLKTSTAAASDDLVQVVTDATAPAAEAPKSEAVFGPQSQKTKTKEPA